MRRLLGAVAAVLLLGVLGTAGWAAWQLYRHDREATGQLQEAQTALTKSQDRLMLLEQERRALAEDFDTLKARWVSADEKAQRLAQESDQLAGQLAGLEDARRALQQQLEEASAQRQQLQAQVKGLQESVAKDSAQRSALEARLADAQRRALSRAELEQLADRWSAQQQMTQDVLERLETISRANSQLAAAAPAAPAESPRTPSSADEPRRAAKFRRVGDIYFSNHQYPQAADAYERSLELTDHATTRAKLTFLYDRFLHDHARARHHTELAKDTHINPALAALSNNPSGTKVPRAHWRLVWDWLTK
ncbi:MAG: hypothetical protein COV75_07190 [Candidatus Omnitrophica bacterium CG11_big_fil_rev_8_21_14_0_20_63_9]|nr:MAG: hypothetical protein COV75_07190 [Candidatus Omnitrophica bacterium CG11_big_fil_rev_8_21_14_0_20_63_9]